MKRVLKYLTAIIISTAVIIGIGATAWLLGTANGARWLLTTVAHRSGLDISAKTVEGKLAGTLVISQLNIGWAEGSASVGQTKLSLRPIALLIGKVHLQTAGLKNIVITDNAPEKPPVLQWPKVPGIIAWMSGACDRLDVENLAYRRFDEKPVRWIRMTAELNWRRGYLSFRKFDAVSDSASLSGDIRAGFYRPLLDLDIVAIPSQPLADMGAFRLTGKFLPGANPEQIAGHLLVTGKSRPHDAKPLWELSLDAAMTAQGFPLRNMRLTRMNSDGGVTASGMLTFRGAKPYLSMAAEAKDVDWTADFNVPVKLSGSLSLEGTVKKYGGNFSFANAGKSWQSVRLAGHFSGDDRAVKMNIENGTAMDGLISGILELDWREGALLTAHLNGRNLNPATIEKKWSGEINFDFKGRLQTADNQTPRGELSLQLRQSRLHGQSLTGNLRAAFTGEDFLVQDCALKGKGFAISASGDIGNKLDFSARISDFSYLTPKASGSLDARGWMRYRRGKPGGAVSARALGLAFEDLAIASADIRAALDDGYGSPAGIKAILKKIRYGKLRADALTLTADGTPRDHTAAAVLRAGQSEVVLGLSGSYHHDEWRAKISRLEGLDKIGPWRLLQPSGWVLSPTGFTLDPLIIKGVDAETVKASLRLTRTPLSGAVQLDWKDVNLQRLSAWLDRNDVTGSTEGSLHLNFLPHDRIALSAKAALQGTMNVQGKTVGIRQGLITAEANEKGTHLDCRIFLNEGAILKGRFDSAAPAGLSFPEDGRFTIHLQDVDPSLLSPFLPEPFRVEGTIAAEAAGRFLSGKRISMTGRASVMEARLHLRAPKSDIRIAMKEASLDWVWQDDVLNGNLLMKLTDSGRLQGSFRLPIASRIPVTFDEKGTIQASLAGTVMEKGTLTALFPGVIQESRGKLDVDLRVGGAWKDPHLTGEARLSQAGGYLPSAGITVKDARINARFADNAVFIDSISASSGPGHVEGNAVIRLKDGKITGFEGRLNGDRFQTIYFPELQVHSSPRLTFSGTPGKIAVDGEILLPDVSIIGAKSSRSVEVSPDVVRAGKTKPVPGKLPFELDARVNIILGQSVLFNMSGIDARLGGNVDLRFQGLDKIIGRGEIRVAKGRFQTYGVDLDIVRGRLTFTGGPVNQPGLDILALKTVGDVKAGVTVSGTLQSPLIKLYSEPAMQDTDVLAYIVLGHPLGNNTEQANLLAIAAKALLSTSQAEGLQAQIKSRLGLASFDISAGVVEKNGRMGYKPVKMSAAGAGTSASSENVGETMVVIGRYLTPKLYISYGRSLFTGSNLFSLRYNLSPNWQVESQTGNVSGVDIYYKLEFN